MPTQLGLGLGIPLGQGIAWFNSSAYADLAAIADFNNDQYALPALGPELVTNGDFASGSTGWTNSSTGTGSISFTGGQLTVNRVDASNKGVAIQSLSGTSVGSTYEINATVVSGTAFFGLASGGGNYTAGPVKFYTTAVLSNQSLTIECPNNGSSCVVDNVSVREVILTRNAVALGANLVTNGTFTTDTTGWTPSGSGDITFSSVSGALNMVRGAGSNAGLPIQTISGLTIGTKYQLVFTTSINPVAFQVTGGSVPIAANSSGTVGFKTYEFTASATSHSVSFWPLSPSTTAAVDDVGLRAIPAIGSYPKRSATFAEWFAFTAASDTARSYVDQSGTWRNSAYGVTNHVLNSKNFGGTNWIINNSPTVTQNYAANIDGTITASRLQTSGGGGAGYYVTGAACVANRPKFSHFWIKNNGGAGSLTIGIGGGFFSSGGDRGATFNPTTGVLSSVSADFTSSNVTLDTNGFWRIDLGYTPQVTGSPGAHFIYSSGATAIDVLVGNVQAYDGQLNPTPVFSTPGAAALGGVNAPRFDFRNGKRQLRLEDARRNSIRNSSGVGATAGVVGSGGALPTNWGHAGGNTSGLAVTVVGTGLENGLPYVDIRYSGTTTNTGFELIFEGAGVVAASAGQTWVSSHFVRMVGGSTANIVGVWSQVDGISGSPGAGLGPSVLPTNAPLRQTSGGFSLGTGTTSVRCGLAMTVTNGAAVDVTLRISQPQLEQASFASDPILTTSAAVTRAIETARFSPLLEAIMQRAAGSVVVRGMLDADGTSSADVRTIVGLAAFCILGSRNSTAMRQISDSGVADDQVVSGGFVLPWGVGYSFDSSAVSMAKDGAVGAHTQLPGSRSQVYLGRPGAGAITYGHGLYDFVGISPERLPSATLQALAVPA